MESFRAYVDRKLDFQQIGQQFENALIPSSRKAKPKKESHDDVKIEAELGGSCGECDQQIALREDMKENYELQIQRLKYEIQISNKIQQKKDDSAQTWQIQLTELKRKCDDLEAQLETMTETHKNSMSQMVQQNKFQLQQLKQARDNIAALQVQLRSKPEVKATDPKHDRDLKNELERMKQLHQILKQEKSENDALFLTQIQQLKCDQQKLQQRMENAEPNEHKAASNQQDDGHRINTQYLQNVMLQYLQFPCGSDERRQLIPVIGTVLRFSDKEMELVSAAESKWTLWQEPKRIHASDSVVDDASPKAQSPLLCSTPEDC